MGRLLGELSYSTYTLIVELGNEQVESREASQGQITARASCLEQRQDQVMFTMRSANSGTICTSHCQVDEPSYTYVQRECFEGGQATTIQGKQYCTYNLTDYTNWRQSLDRVERTFRTEVRSCVRHALLELANLEIRTEERSRPGPRSLDIPSNPFVDFGDSQYREAY